MPKLRIVTQEGLASEELSAYKAVSPADFKQLESLLPVLTGKHILHLSSSANGGGVAELLTSGCALERALGLRSQWAIIEDAMPFFVITKKIHNGLQGESLTLSPLEQKTYLNITPTLRADLETLLHKLQPDIIILHDPQPLPFIEIAKRFAPTLLRLHIDLSTPYQPMLDFLKPLIRQASTIIISSNNYRVAFGGYPPEHIAVIRPAIDPFTEKNRPLDKDTAEEILTKHNIDITRPFITQISRFDPWKDPLGAIEAYRFAKHSVPKLQLILAGFIEASDDPEALAWVDKTKAAVQNDPDVFIFSDLSQLKDSVSDSLFINALNTLTSCTLQMSRREGFGLTITEAMWKGRVVIARPSRGAELQIINGENGYISDTSETIAGHVIKTLADSKTAQAIGRAAQASVKENFFLPRYISHNCKVYQNFL